FALQTKWNEGHDLRSAGSVGGRDSRKDCGSLVIFVRTHVSGSQITVVPAQRFRQQVWRVFAIRQALCPAEIVEEQWFVVRTGALLDDEVRSLARREAA